MNLLSHTSTLALAVVLLAGCTAPTAPRPASSPEPAEGPAASEAPSETPDVSALPATLTVAGQEEIVFAWATDRCEDENIPDLAARAFRDSTGQVHLTISHSVNYQMLGPDLDHLKMSCTPTMRSSREADPAAYNDHEWIAATYTEDGQTVYALVHNEYQGHTHPGYCPQGEYFPCWDNSITLAVSTDGGNTFSEAAPPPGNLVARLPFPYVAGAGPIGLRNPSSILKAADGYYYSFSNATRDAREWVCAMRTADISDPSAWRFWDGDAFEGVFVDPSASAADAAGTHYCADYAMDQIGWALGGSVTYNTYLERYVMVGLGGDRDVWGAYYSFSTDLVLWTYRKLLLELPLPWTVADAGSDLSMLYPTLIDPASASLNFDTSGQTAYLYYTRHNHGQGSLDRDLIRVKVEFTLEQ